MHERIDWSRIESEQGQACGLGAEVTLPSCQAQRDAQLFAIWPRPEAAALDAPVACQPATRFWKSDAIARHAHEKGLSANVLRDWIVQKWARFHFGSGERGRCQSFVIAQWQRSTGQPEFGSFTEADVDDFVRNWQPILDRFKQIGANVVQRNRDERQRLAQQAQAEAEASTRAQAEALRQEQEAERQRQARQQERDSAAEKLLAQDRLRVESALAKRRPRLKAECTDSARASAAAARSRDLSMWAHGDIQEYHIRHEKDLFDQDYRRCIHAATHQMALELLESDRR